MGDVFMTEMFSNCGGLHVDGDIVSFGGKVFVYKLAVTDPSSEFSSLSELEALLTEHKRAILSKM